MSDIIQAEHIIKDYTGHRALDDVSVSIPEGSIYGLLGPNGAGKTTLIRIMNHITVPDSGQILFQGNRMTEDDVYKIGYLPEERGLYKKMRVGDHALYLARLKGMTRSDALVELKRLFKKFDILPWWNKKIEELSKGMAQKIQFIVTIVHHPKLLIFDEPFSGFDPINTNLLKSEILSQAENGATIIFSTHNMSSVEEICDHFTLINKSRNILSGTVDEVRASYGRNDFSLTYNGDSADLKERLSEYANVYEEKSLSAFDSIKFTTTCDVERSELITKINDIVKIEDFHRIIPSMNDIFINAVQNNSAQTDIENRGGETNE